MGTVEYADELVLLAKEGRVREGMTDRLTEIGRCYGMEMSLEQRESPGSHTQH